MTNAQLRRYHVYAHVGYGHWDALRIALGLKEETAWDDPWQVFDWA